MWVFAELLELFFFIIYLSNTQRHFKIVKKTQKNNLQVTFFQKICLEKYLIYEAEISQNSYMLKFWTIKFLNWRWTSRKCSENLII